MVVILLVFLLSILPVQAGEILKSNTGKFYRFDTLPIYYRIDPNLPEKKRIQQYIEDQMKLCRVQVIFDGYKEAGNRFQGVYIVYDTKLAAYGVVDFVSKIETTDHYDLKQVHAKVSKFAYSNNKDAAIIAFHEFLHALGLAHNNDASDILYPGYSTGRVWRQHSIDTLNELYKSL